MSNYQSFLRLIPMFSELPDDELERLCASVNEIHLQPGEVLLSEGSMDPQAFIILDGMVEIYKTVDGRDVQLALRQSGDLIGELSLLENAPRSASGRALIESRVLAVDRDRFTALVDSNPGLARAMLHTVTERLRMTELMLHQRERLAHLGMFSAGLAHELNNPSAAVQRSAEQLREAIQRIIELYRQLEALHFDPALLSDLREWAFAVRDAPESGRGATSSVLDESDREAELEAWFTAHGIVDAWDSIAILAEMRIGPEELDRRLAGFPAQAIGAVVQWLSAALTISALLREIGLAAAQMSEIVKALKSYVHLDEAPAQDVDVHTGLEDTLVILRHKLKNGVVIERDFAPDLPKIHVYGRELNQVWTNLIDNAIDALQGSGRIMLRTRSEGPWVVVSVEDNGPGIPAELQSRLFSPFFTTKEPGKGTGLGLSISYNIVRKHGGEMTVRSQPGKTVFDVRLPVEFEKMGSASSPAVLDSSQRMRGSTS